MPTPAPQNADTQLNWLELARLAAAGEGHADLARGVRRLAVLAAAVHRGRAASTHPTNVICTAEEKEVQRVHGRTPQAQPTKDGPR
ncbi:MAG: hypothetical protein AAFX76_05915 [Planctomycetota bacterium]